VTRVRKIDVGSQIGAGLSGYIAEMAGAFVCAALGIVPSVRHADYIGSWLEIWRGEHIESNREVEVMWRNADLARESRTIPPVQGEPCSALF